MKALFALAVFLSSVSFDMAAENVPQKEDDNIREVVFRALFKDVLRARDGVKVFFISGEEWRSDPPGEFISRFAGNQPPVHRVSESAEKAGKVFDRRTGERGIIFSVDRLAHKSDAEAEIRGSVYRAGLNGYAETYTLRKKDGKWSITNKKLDFIS